MSVRTGYAVTSDSVVSVLVDNSFNFSEDQALTFGTVVALTDPALFASLAVDPAGNADLDNNGDAKIIEFIQPIVGRILISGAAPNTTINIAFPTSVTLACGIECSGNQPDFTVDSFDADTVGGMATTDASGNATINYGARLSTTPNNNPYEDGDYIGIVTVEARY